MPSIENMIFDSTSRRLASAMQVAGEKQAMYAYNIANAATPRFKPLRFDEELKKATDKYSNEGEMSLEEEMALMSENRLKHSAYSKLLSARIQIAKKIMTLGKGG